MSQKSGILLGVIVDVHLGNLIHVATSYRELDKSVQLKVEEDGKISIFVCILKPSGKYSCQVSNAWLQALSQHLRTQSQTSSSSCVKSDCSLLHVSLKVWECRIK